MDVRNPAPAPGQEPAGLPEGERWRKTIDPDGSIRVRVRRREMGYPRFENETEETVDIVIPCRGAGAEPNAITT
jgi:hypothetical protein